MSDFASASRRTNTRLLLAIFGIVVLIAVVFLLVRLFSGSSGRPLRPALPPPTPILDNGMQATAVSFSDLNASPFSYVNQLIEVSGNYTPQPPPECVRYSGPYIRWALISEGLRLDAVGYERIVRLLAPDTPMTVRGIWRMYSGPVGCGKGPARETVWYLQVVKILQPNPLIGANGSPINIDPGKGLPGFPELVPTAEQPITTPPEGATATPTAPGTLLPETTPTIAPIETLPPGVTPSASPTFLPGTTPTVDTHLPADSNANGAVHDNAGRKSNCNRNRTTDAWNR